MFSTTSIDLARAYLAAHLGTVTRWQGASIAGPVIREADGRLEREYSVIPSAMSTPFNTTSYGTLLQFLIDTSKARLPRVLL
jgi:hypothetical protein